MEKCNEIFVIYLIFWVITIAYFSNNNTNNNQKGTKYITNVTQNNNNIAMNCKHYYNQSHSKPGSVNHISNVYLLKH